MSRRQSNELVPIPEHTSIDLTLASPRPRLSSSSSLTPEDFDACAEEELQPVPSPSIAKMSRSACVNVNDAKWHTLSFCELRDTLGKLKESKKVYKRKINEVESGTSNNDLEESINDMYVLYKATKYKIKLIKALIEKQSK